MRYYMFVTAAVISVVLTTCTTTSDLVVLSSTPASVEFAAWCPSIDDPQCRQKVADAAQAHCRDASQNAQYVRSLVIERNLLRGERVQFVYNCVR